MAFFLRLLIILPLTIWGIGMILIAINRLKGVIINKSYEGRKATALKFTTGLVILIPLSYCLISFYSYTSVNALFLSVDDMTRIYDGFKAMRDVLETGVADAPYILYVPAIIMILGYYIHFLWIRKSWHKYFKIIAVLGIIFLYNAYLAYRLGYRSHEMDIVVGTAELNSTYGLTEMISDVNVWTIIICGFTGFVVWSVVLNRTICAYNQLR